MRSTLPRSTLAILGVAERVAETAAVAEPEVEEAVGADGERAAVVLHGLGVVDRQEHPAAVAVRAAGGVQGIGGEHVVVGALARYTYSHSAAGS